jgi:hypothetical protein
MDGNRTGPQSSSYVIAAAAAIGVCYWLLGGWSWSLALWAVCAMVAIGIVVMNVRRDAGLESPAWYARWKLRLAFVLVLTLISPSIWQESLGLFALSVALGAMWVSDLRAYRTIQ